ncbi:MAG: FAD binding domain-containing protein [Planctomycetota bacterium]|nr:FAD binding domain-containing protein [Planctomycetota bacterium]
MSAPVVVSPRTLDEALAALADGADGADGREETLLLAGGTDLMVEFENGRTTPRHVIDIWALDELRGIRAENGGLRLGALTNCTELVRSPLVPEILADSAREVGAAQIMNRATLGGNLGTASPAADLNPVLFALSAVVRLRSARGTRDVPVAEFVTGYRKNGRSADELIESVWIPARPAGERRAFRKVGTRKRQSISKVVLAAAATVEDGRVASVTAAAGSIAERTLLLPSIAAELTGVQPDGDTIERAARAAAERDVTPIDDVRSTAAYRREVLYRLLRRMLGDVLR